MVESVRRKKKKCAVSGEWKGEAVVGTATAPALDARARRTLFLGSFPIIEIWEDVGGKRKYVADAKTQAEVRALRILRILHRHERDGEKGREDVDEATEALEILRSWGSRGRAWA